jgi:hypothetical protein
MAHKKGLHGELIAACDPDDAAVSALVWRIARRPSPCDVPRGPCCGERYRSKTDTTERM